MNSPIPVSCRTNLDEYQRERWPAEMIVRPLVGDRVRAMSGKVLKVVSVTHAIREGRAISQVDRVTYPILEVELHK